MAHRADAEPAHNEVRSTEEVHASDEGSLRRPANDDRESIGQLLHSLQRRPSRTSYVYASVFAGLWVLAGLVLGWMYLPELQSAFGPTGLTAPVMAVLAAAFFVPIIFFYVLAHMAWRSQELRLITQSMAEVAMRLAEPETVARESIVTVGQAIRREVAAMGDGIERALARAAELETLVANEVSALEHAYNDNEVRIRALLQDLGSQRDTLVGQAGQIRDAINGVHLDLSHDISQVSELVAEQVNEASRRITHALSEKGEHITRALGNAGDTMIQTLGERGGDLLDRLEAASQDTAQAISAASDRLTATLNFKTDHIGDEFTEITANLQHMMSTRLDRGNRGLCGKVRLHPRPDGLPLAGDERPRDRYRQPAYRDDLQPRRRGEHHAQEYRQFARARPEPARRRRRVQARTDRRAYHRHHRAARRPGDRPVARKRRIVRRRDRQPQRRGTRSARHPAAVVRGCCSIAPAPNSPT